MRLSYPIQFHMVGTMNGFNTKALGCLLSKTGNCHISVEHAGPDFAAPTTIRIIPDEIRGMAGHVIDQCVLYENGIGGFVTKGFAHLLEYIRISGNWIEAPGQNRMSYQISCPYFTLIVRLQRSHTEYP